jgi:hypothetical protein
MHDFGEIFGPLTGSRISRRLSQRQHEDEARISEVPPRPGHEKNLSEHVPSALLSLEDRVRAMAVGGAPAWSRRLKRIHDMTNAAEAEAHDAWRKLAASVRGNAGRFAVEWQRHVSRIDFSVVNAQIQHHNHYFPMEANLAMDPRTLDYVKFGGEDYRRRLLTAGWILAQFPPDLQAALARPSRPTTSTPPAHR